MYRLRCGEKPLTGYQGLHSVPRVKNIMLATVYSVQIGKIKANLRTVGDLAAPLPRGQLVKQTRLLAELAAALTGAFRTRNPSNNSAKIQSVFA